MDPISGIVFIGVRCGVRWLSEKLQPKIAIRDSVASLTNEEASLLEMYQFGQRLSPCVICGGKCTHVVDMRMQKVAKKEKSGFLFNRKETIYWDKRIVSVTLCSKHYRRIVFQDLVHENFFILLAVALVVMSAYLFLKDGTFADSGWFEYVLAIVGAGIGVAIVCGIIAAIWHFIFPGKSRLYKFNPLNRLKALGWEAPPAV